MSTRNGTSRPAQSKRSEEGTMDEMFAGIDWASEEHAFA